MSTYHSVLQHLVGQAMAHPLFAGLFVDALYRVVRPGTYDPVTGTLSPVTVDELPLHVQVYSYRAEELIPDVVLPTDRKILVQQAEYPTEPSNQHELQVGDTLYSIVGVTEESPGITWTMHARRKGLVP